MKMKALFWSRIIFAISIPVCTILFFLEGRNFYIISALGSLAALILTFAKFIGEEPIISLQARKEYKGKNVSGIPTYNKILEIKNVGKTKAIQVKVSQIQEGIENKVLDAESNYFSEEVDLDREDSHRFLLPIDSQSESPKFKTTWTDIKGNEYEKVRELNFQ